MAQADKTNDRPDEWNLNDQLGVQPKFGKPVDPSEWDEATKERQRKMLSELKANPDIRWLGDVEKKTPEWTYELLRKDRFPVRTCGAVVNEVYGHEAVSSMPIEPHLYNTTTQLMGGATFTLGDFASAIADIMPGIHNSTVDAHIQYLAPGSGKVLIARAHCEHYGRTLAYYSVDFTTETGKHVAKGSYTYIHIPIKKNGE